MTQSLDLTRTFQAPPALVWRALTDESAVPAWFWPFPTSAEIDARPGGAYRLTSNVISLDGTVEGADPARELTLDWRWAGEEAHTRVRVALAPAGGGTELRVTHGGFADAAARDDHVQGWSDCLDRLPAWLATHA